MMDEMVEGQEMGVWGMQTGLVHGGQGIGEGAAGVAGAI